MRYIQLSIVLAVAALAGCAAMPDPLEGEQYTEAFFPEQAVDRSLGAKVRWGGTVVETSPGSDRTCIEILAQELDRSSRPLITDEDYGRFIACRDEFIDPEIFVSGREVTIVGELSQFRDGKIGEYDYKYPMVAADAVYLWPERADYPRSGYGYYPYGYPYYYRPYFYGFHGFHGFHGGFHHRARIGFHHVGRIHRSTESGSQSSPKPE